MTASTKWAAAFLPAAHP